MKLFSNNADMYFDNGNYVKAKMEDFYHRFNDKNSSFWYQADLDSRFEAGDQSVWEALYRTPANRKNLFNFNRIRRIVNMVSGHQRRNRNNIVVTPVENGDQLTADQYTKIIFHINRNDYVLESVSQAFHDSLITGLSFLHVWNDYRLDPISGALKVDVVPYNSFIIDPFFRKSDLSDCNGIWKRTFISKNEAHALLPDKKKEIEEIRLTVPDNLFSFMPETTALDTKDLLAYDEFYYLDTRKQVLLIDSQTGESIEWSYDKESDNLNQFLRAYPTVSVVETDIPTVKLAILLQGVLVYDDKNPMGVDRYPFIPVLGYFNPNMSSYDLKIQGMVRNLRDVQYLFNRRKNIELDILESQINSGIIYKEDALVDPNDAFLTGQGKGLALKATAQMTDVMPIPTPQISPSLFQLSELLAREIMEISGVNEELLGSAEDDKAGILSMLRQGAGLTTLQVLFDQLDRSLKQLGSLLLNAIQCNYTPGKVKRIIEQEPAPQFYSKAFGKYDASVEGGFSTPTQRNLEFVQLVKIKELGYEIPEEFIIKSATIQNKDEIIQAMQQAQQAQQQQQAKMEETQQQLQTAQAELAKAKVESDLALANERDSRVYSNIGLMENRKIDAEKDKTQSVLNLVKTLQEIDDIDIDQLTKLITLYKTMNIPGEPTTLVSGTGVPVTGTDSVKPTANAIISGMTKKTDAGIESRKPTL